MSRDRTLTGDDVRRLRLAAQRLHRPGRSSATELVRHLTGVQAQVLSAAALALRARTEGLTSERVAEARVHDRSIVLTWAMRGTLHLITAEDYGWLVPLVLGPRVPHAHRRLREEGVTAAQSDVAVRSIERMLERNGPLGRSEIAERLRRRGIRTEGQAIAHLLWLAAARGVICHGPARGPDQRFVLVRDWLGEPEPMEREPALAELAVRYLAAHGPSEPADLALWSGIAVADAKRAWTSIEDRLVEVRTINRIRWSLRSPAGGAPRRLVRLLPAFDEYLLGWKDRETAVPIEHRTEVNRGGGWIRPVLLVDGRAVGTWSTDRTSNALRLEVRPFSPPETWIRSAIDAEAQDLGEFLGLRVEPAVA
jgi:hypothetical protein